MTAIDLAGLQAEPAGVVKMFAGLSAQLPPGYLICDGSNVSRTQYAALFAAIGTLHGVGDGSTTFGLPNLKSRLVMGQDPSDPNFQNVGNITGSPNHIHYLSDLGMACIQQGGSGAATGNNPIRRVNTPTTWTRTHSNGTALSWPADNGTATTGAALMGQTDSTNQYPPTVVMHFIIKT